MIVAAVVLFSVVCFVRWQHPSVVSPTIRGLGLVAVAIMLVGAYIGGRLVYQGGLGIDPAILKPGLRSMPEPNSSPAEALRELPGRDRGRLGVLDHQVPSRNVFPDPE